MRRSRRLAVNESDIRRAALGMNHNENAMPQRPADQQKPRLVVRMVWIRHRDRERVRERRTRFVEGDPVFSEIRGCFPGIPTETQSHLSNLSRHQRTRMTEKTLLRGQTEALIDPRHL